MKTPLQTLKDELKHLRFIKKTEDRPHQWNMWTTRQQWVWRRTLDKRIEQHKTAIKKLTTP